jgi:predicted alpha-1,2-mannosidase
MGISTVDLENARTHREQEVGDKSFDEVRAESAAAWNEAFGRGKVEFPSDTPNDVRIQYYTSLYHAFMMPMVWSEHDDRYLAFDDTVKQTDGFTFYTDFSMWDTYRNLHPLLFLLFPDESADMMRSLLEMGKYEGCLPHWVLANGDSGSMIGRPASIIVADAWLHGIPIQDEELMMKLLYQSHAVPIDNEDILPCSAEDGLQDSRKYGYIPADLHGGSVSKTQENAWGDYCVAVVAKAKDDQEVATHLFEQSLNSYNLYYDVTGFFQGRNADGSWVPDLSRFFWEEYFTEGNAWQYLWLVPHDPVGLAEIMGGEETFFARLDEFFTETKAWDNPYLPPRHYFHGNEPDIHAPFLYSAMGRPASSAKWSRWIMDAEYSVSPEGLAGNDDAGTMAAWYVFATLGFYPYPCTGKYLMGTPRVSEAWLNSLGKPLHILVEDASESRLYVKSVTWDGEPVLTPWFTLQQLQKGGEVVFTMSEEPTEFGTGITFPTVPGK